MYLLRRVEPLVIGLHLELGRLNEDYRPTFHVFNLANPYPSMTFSLKQQLHYPDASVTEYIDIKCSDEKWRDAAKRFQEQVPMLAAKNLDLSTVVEAYRKSTKINYQLRDFEDIISLMSWCGRTEMSTTYLEEAVATISSWSKYILDKMAKYDNFQMDQWYDKQRLVAQNPSIPREQVTKSIQQFKLEKIPVSPFGCS